ncbi:CRISPR-associated protein, Cmr5 family [Rubrobacter xylanophilus DSM 9941]|uniref:CRISPR type III-B/RAMP module-associated protein Cmr5 n=1 Tax=Rubrobacter xylanophilus (strain DSM 9941 / JCM 11954 / NBRC 16129 / PRD-1) TaxID=266117 RepID=Q1AZE1_RUBXD|nr:type III-B CRISPR module-associated protein Cmr5 [Rubrobacter xylanophilus]ABG03237.1 CRISPR-associated protein, Cmr5 family [Rubrobacter xylanophilus DSM 9941]
MAEERTLEQRRAAHALAAIQELQRAGRGGYGNYKSYVSSLPATILTNGLGQAAATLLAGAKLNSKNRNADNRAREKLYDHLSSWLCGGDEESPYQKKGDLLENITRNDQDCYIRAQAEALEYLSWLKRFAEAFLEGSKGEK